MVSIQLMHIPNPSVYLRCMSNHSEFHWPLGYKAPSVEYLNKNIGSSLAVNTYMAISADKCKADDESDFFVSSLIKLVVLACSSIDTVDTVAQGTLTIGSSNIVIDRQGQVSGFKDCMEQRSIHVSIRTLLKKDT